MKRVVVGIIAAAVLVSMASTAMAQTKTIASETRVESATVEAVEAASRTLTLKKPDGTYVVTVAGPDIARFAEIKVGQKVNVRYIDNVIVRLKKPGEPDVDTAAKATTGSGQAMPGGTRAKQRTITAVDHGDRPEHAVDHLHRAERLEVLVQGGGQGSSRQSQGRRQGRHCLDRSGAGVGRARQVGGESTAGAVRRDRSRSSVIPDRRFPLVHT